MRLDWQEAVSAAISTVMTAHGLDSTIDLRVFLSSSGDESAAQPEDALRQLRDSMSVPPFASTPAPPSISSVALKSYQTAAAKFADGNLDTMNELFAKFDDMSLGKAFERIIPAVKKADEQGQYLAMCVNIQLASLVVNYIQAVSARALFVVSANFGDILERSRR